MRLFKLLTLLVLVQLKLSSQDSSQTSSISIGEILELHSSILEETREIYIYEPQGLWGMDENMTNLPVIIVLDGESQFNHTATTVDFLSIATNGNDFMPRSIVVGIPNKDDRSKDLTPVKDSNFPTSGGGKNFLAFITDELIPYIDANYNTSNHRTIIGHSLGGLITFEALLRKRDYFDNYILIDPASGFANGSVLNEVIDSLNHSELSTENVFCSVANNRPSFLSEEDMMNDTSELIKFFGLPNQKFINAQASSNWNINLTIKFYPDENHYSIPHVTTHDAFRELYDYYTFPEISNYYHPAYKDKTDLVEKIKEHYKNISQMMGYQVLPMQGYINSFGYGLAHFDREDLAIDLLRYNVDLHPDDPVMYNNLGNFYMSKGYDQLAIDMYSKSLELQDDEWVSKTINELRKQD